MGYRVLPPCRPVTRHSPSEKRPQLAISNQTGPDSRPGQSYRYDLAEPVLTGFDLAGTVHPKRAQDGPARASFPTQLPQGAPWICYGRPAFAKNRRRAFPLSSLRAVTLSLKASSGPCRNRSQLRKHWLRKFLRLGDPWIKGLKWHRLRKCKESDIRMMTWKTCRLLRLLQDKGQHQMTSLTHLPQVEGRLGIDNDHIRYSQSMILAWSQPVASTCVPLDILPKSGTFAQAKEFSSWRTARA